MSLMSKKKCEWYCYVCGKLIERTFTLNSMTNSTDRVFLAHKKCSEQFDSGFAMTVVKQGVKYQE